MSATATTTSPGRLHRARVAYLIVPLVAAAALISAGYAALDDFATDVAATVQPIEGLPDVAAGTSEAPADSEVTAIAAQ